MTKATRLKRPDLDWDELFQTLTQSPLQISLVVSGGGSGAVARCFRRPGASQGFVEAVIPYSRTALASYLAVEPRGTAASPQRARQLAETALARALALADRDPPYATAGISLVAALPTTVKRRFQKHQSVPPAGQNFLGSHSNHPIVSWGHGCKKPPFRRGHDVDRPDSESSS